jgi:hypothetical protein
MQTFIGLVALALLFLVLKYGWPAAGFLFFSFLPLGAASSDRWANKPWAKAISAVFTPICIAMAFLTLFVILANVLEPTEANAYINWQDYAVIRLYRFLKWVDPPTPLYLFLLIASGYLGYKFPEWDALNRLTIGKKRFGKVLAIITTIASVTFVGQSKLVAPKFESLQLALQMAYRIVTEKTEHASQNYLAERTVSKALQNLDPTDRRTMQKYFLMLSFMNVNERYQRHLGALYVHRETGVPSLDLSSLVGSPPAPLSPDAVPTEPEELIPALEKQKSLSTKAVALEKSSRQTLTEVTSQVFDFGNKRATEAAEHYIDQLVSLYSERYAQVLKPVLHGFLQPLGEKYAGAYLERVTQFAASKLKWRGVPQGDDLVLYLTIHNDELMLAEIKLSEAEATSKSVVAELNNPARRTSFADLKATADDAKEEVTQAGQILHASPEGSHSLNAHDALSSEISDFLAVTTAQQSVSAADEAAMRAVAAHEAEIEAEKAAAKALVRALEHVR